MSSVNTQLVAELEERWANSLNLVRGDARKWVSFKSPTRIVIAVCYRYNGNCVDFHLSKNVKGIKLPAWVREVDIEVTKSATVLHVHIPVANVDMSDLQPLFEAAYFR